MHSSPSCLVFCAIALVTLAPARADEPGDLYLDGFRACMRAEEHQKTGSINKALEQLKEAERVILEVQKQFPDWQPDIVKYRLANIRKRMAEFTLPTRPAKPDPASAAPLMPTVKPSPMFFERPSIPFIFNGSIYYKMLLSSQP
jgi:hypothetical protein